MTEQDIKIKILWAIAILTLVVSSIISTHYARKRLKARRELKKEIYARNQIKIDQERITQEGTRLGMNIAILLAIGLAGVGIEYYFWRRRR